MTMATDDSTVAEQKERSKTLRLLCLHPKNSNSKLFKRELAGLQNTAGKCGLELDLDFLDAPNLFKRHEVQEKFDEDDPGPGRVWWYLPDGARSYT